MVSIASNKKKSDGKPSTLSKPLRFSRHLPIEDNLYEHFKAAALRQLA